MLRKAEVELRARGPVGAAQGRVAGRISEGPGELQHPAHRNRANTRHRCSVGSDDTAPGVAAMHLI